MKTNVSFECIIFFNYSLQLWSGIFSFWNIKLFDYYTRDLTTNQFDGHFTFNNIVNWFSITSSILKTVIQWKFWYCPRNVKLLRNFQIHTRSVAEIRNLLKVQHQDQDFRTQWTAKQAPGWFEIFCSVSEPTYSLWEMMMIINEVSWSAMLPTSVISHLFWNGKKPPYY